MGITGQWGSGKSSIINFVERKLSEAGIITIKFNPLFYNSIEANLTYSFFSELTTSIKKEKKFKKETIKLFKNFLKIAKHLPNHYVRIGSEALSEIIDKKEGVAELKEKINNHLRTKLKKTIVVFIDDLDRLNKEEILNIFQLVKMNADFSNIIYVLSYDSSVVCKILEGQQSKNGRKYLDKIIQNEFECPILTPKQLESYFLKVFQSLFPIIKELDKNPENFRESLDLTLSTIIKTPRDVVRIYNKFISDFLYIHRVNSLKNLKDLEIDLGDLFLLDILKIYYPGTYVLIYENKKRFVYKKKFPFEMGNTEEDLPDIDIISKKDEGLKAILKQLFPFSEGSFRHTIRKRLYNGEDFNTYFSMDYRESELTQKDYNRIMKSLNDKRVLSITMGELTKEGKIRPMLKELFSNIKEKKIGGFRELENLTYSLLKIAQDLDQASQIFLMSDFSYAVEIIIKIIEQISSNEIQVTKLLKLILSEGDNWMLPLQVINVLDWRIRRNNLEEITIDMIPIEPLKKEISKKAGKDFLKIMDYNKQIRKDLLYLISLWGGKKINKELLAYLKEDNLFVDFIDSLKIYSTSHGVAGTTIEVEGINLECLKQVYGIEITKRRLEKIASQKSKELLSWIAKSKINPHLGNISDEGEN